MGYEGGVRTREGKQTKRSRAGTVFLLLVEMWGFSTFRLVNGFGGKGSAEEGAAHNINIKPDEHTKTTCVSNVQTSRQ